MDWQKKLAKDRIETQSDRLVYAMAGDSSREAKLERLSCARARLNEELDFFWKRATYFSVVLGFVVAAIGSIFSQGVTNIGCEQNIVLLGFSLLGLLISTCWYFANRGGKFWYERWENIVDALEVDLYGAEFYMTKYGSPIERCGASLLSGQRYSVTKIAILLSFLMAIVFAMVAIYPLNSLFKCGKYSEPLSSAVFVALIALVLCFGLVAIFTKAETDS